MRTPLILTLVLMLASCAQPPAPAPDTGPDPKNELPFGWIDLPKPETEVPASSRIEVSGWALDDGSVKEVRVFVDNYFRAKSDITLERADLADRFSSYLHGTNVHGWKVEIEVPSVNARHAILAQAVDDRGATRDLPLVFIIVK